MNERAKAFQDMLAMMAVRATPDELRDYCFKEYDAAMKEAVATAQLRYPYTLGNV